MSLIGTSIAVKIGDFFLDIAKVTAKSGWDRISDSLKIKSIPQIVTSEIVPYIEKEYRITDSAIILQALEAIHKPFIDKRDNGSLKDFLFSDGFQYELISTDLMPDILGHLKNSFADKVEYEQAESIVYNLFPIYLKQIFSLKCLVKDSELRRYQSIVEFIESSKKENSNEHKEIQDTLIQILNLLENRSRLEDDYRLSRIDGGDNFGLRRYAVAPQRTEEIGAQWDYTTPCFVRSSGPSWIDFEKDYVYEDKELIEKYIHQLIDPENKEPIVLKGEAASGKSVLLRSIAYHLISDYGATVYYIALKPGEIPDAPLAEIFPWSVFRESNAFLFIDDAHIDSGKWINDLIFKGGEAFTKNKHRMLITSRPIDKGHVFENKHKTTGCTHSHNFMDMLSRIEEMNAVDSIEPVIFKWLLIKSEELGSGNIFKDEEHMIYTVSLVCRNRYYRNNLFGLDNGEGVKHNVGDLWLLAFYLESFSEAEQFPIIELPIITDVVYKYIKADLPKIDNREDYQKSPLYYADELLLLLCYLYKYEIPLPESILDDLLVILNANRTSREKRNSINYEIVLKKLEDYREVIYSSYSYSIPHSARAKIFYDTFVEKQNTSIKIKGYLQDYINKKCPNDQFLANNKGKAILWRLGLIYYLLDKYPSIVAFILYKEEKEIVHALANIANISVFINELISNTKHTWYLLNVARSLENTGYNQWNKILPERLLKAIRITDEPSYVAHLMEMLQVYGYSRWDELLNQMSPELLEEILNNAKYLRDVIYLFEELNVLGYEHFNKISSDVLVKAISKTSSTINVSDFINTLLEGGYTHWEKVFGLFSPDYFLDMLHDKYNIGSIAILIETLHRIGYERWNDLVVQITPVRIGNIIRMTDDFIELAWLIRAFHKIGYDRWNEIPPDELVKAFKQSKEILGIGVLIDELDMAGYNQWPKVLSEYSPQYLLDNLRKTDEILDISFLIRRFNKIGYKRWDEISPIELANAIRKTDDMNYSASLIEEISDAGYTRWCEVFEVFPPEYFLDILLKEPNSWDIKNLDALVKAFNKAGYQRYHEISLEKLEQLAKNKYNLKSFSIWAKIGFILNKFSYFNEALEAYEKAININPQYWYAWNQKGSVLIKLEKYSEALDVFKKVLMNNPINSDAWMLKGIVCVKQEKYQEALDAFCKIRKSINRDENELMIIKGYILANLERYEEAIECFQRSLIEGMCDAEAWYGKSCVLFMMNQTQRSMEHLRKAVKINPDFKDRAIKEDVFDNFKDNSIFKRIVERYN